MAHFRSPASRPRRTGSAGFRQAADGQWHPLGPAHWRAVARYGAWNSVFVRFTRWSKLGVWDAAFETLASVGPPEDAEHAIELDHRAGASACSRRKRGNQNQEALGRSRGGFSTKVHLRTDAKGRPLVFELTGGQAHEVKGYDGLMELFEAQPEKLLGDKGYDADAIRDDLEERGIEPVIPPKANRKEAIPYDREGLQAPQPDRALRQRPQTIPTHRHTIREDREGLPLHAMHRSSKALDQNRQHGPARDGPRKAAYPAIH